LRHTPDDFRPLRINCICRWRQGLHRKRFTRNAIDEEADAGGEFGEAGEGFGGDLAGVFAEPDAWRLASSPYTAALAVVRRDCDQEQHGRQRAANTSRNAEQRFDPLVHLCGHKVADLACDGINDSNGLAAALLQRLLLLRCQRDGHA